MATEEPVCCLIPLDDPPEINEDDVLLSFEQWKDKQASAQSSNKSTPTIMSHRTETTPASDSTSAGAVALPPQEPLDVEEQLSPHFQVPLTDRFNYAALDCSARVHLSHRSAKSASSILSSKKDRYMLSPCNSKEDKFVVVELCDDIRIDTVQLANFEFFSGVFKDITVSVAKTYTEGWTVVETYTGRNIRGVQSFHPPKYIRDFYRYIRIDFHTHYGKEYYCPVSLLRVYGLTHLEQWKWDIWEAEYRARMEETLAAQPEEPETGQTSQASAHQSTPHSDTPMASTHSLVATYGPSTYEEQWSDTASRATTLMGKFVEIVDLQDYAPRHSTDIYGDALSSSPSATSSPTPSSPIVQPAIPTSQSVSRPTDSASASETSSAPSSSKTATSVTTVISPSISMPAPPPIPHSTGGESIYRTIMNRLTALEGNHTLYVRYVDEQNNGARELMRRLGEDIGRLEGIGKAQAQTYQSKLREWEKQRRRIEMDYRELSHRVEHLSDEVILEKRLGIAQLCLLLAVLVFLGLTRGSRNDTVDHVPFLLRKGMRDWSRRHLSFSGEWFNSNRSQDRSSLALKRSPNAPLTSRFGDTPNKRSPRPNQFSSTDETKVVFPMTSASVTARPSSSSHISPMVGAKYPKLALNISQTLLSDVTPGDSRARERSGHTSSSRSRSHTPNPLRTPNQSQVFGHHTHRPTTPTSRDRPQLVRSHSGSGHVFLAGAPKSARRWARTAHLHEVSSPARARGIQPLKLEVPFISPRTISPEYSAHTDPWLNRPMENVTVLSSTTPSDDADGEVDWLDTDTSVDGTEDPGILDSEV